MKVYDKIKSFFKMKIMYWYVVVSSFIVLEICNYNFLAMIVPNWICGIVSIILLILFTFYVSVIFEYLWSGYIKQFANRRQELFERIEILQSHIDELYEKNMEIENTLAEKIQYNINCYMEKSIEDVCTIISCKSEKNNELLQSTANDMKKIFDEKSIVYDGMYEKVISQLISTEDYVSECMTTNLENIKEFIETSFADEKKCIAEATAQTIQNASILASSHLEMLEVSKENIRESIDVNSKEINGLINTVREEISSTKNVVITDTTKIINCVAESKESLVKLLDMVEKVTDSQIENADKLGNKTAELQKEMTQILVQIQDVQDENFEKLERAYNTIFSQSQSISREINQRIEMVQKSIDYQQQVIDSNKEISQNVANEQFLQSNEIREMVNSNFVLVKQYQSGISSGLENMQNQIISINMLIEVMKNTIATQSVFFRSDNPNRIDEIRDVELGVIVLNHYSNDEIVSSEMLTGNKKMYDVEYDSEGRITRSRNYEKNGDLSTELYFYSNGQVKTRIEKVTINGERQMVTTEFDEEGNKIGG